MSEQVSHRNFYDEGLLDTYPMFNAKAAYEARLAQGLPKLVQRSTSSRLGVEVHNRTQEDMERGPYDLVRRLLLPPSCHDHDLMTAPWAVAAGEKRMAAAGPGRGAMPEELLRVLSEAEASYEASAEGRAAGA